ncbi:pleckstrin homology domain-containing family H member 1-like isoform X4 [Varroa destructor]|uniref:Uncharacterized protein n=1 Tax=Varroa destructor TaxID=109461 RepID=A0A7M7KZL6_VARDE|nr:pleckstrin homology domain-containing family H member 1-like isoform X4 [Varroa destructor]
MCLSESKGADVSFVMSKLRLDHWGTTMSSGQVSPMTPRSPPSTGHRQILAQHVSRPIVTPKDDCSTPGAGSQAAVDMQLELAERDVMISTLERQVEEQKQLRALETRQIEQKAARIKDWVSTKLKELEEQNVHLQEQNVKANQQLDQLKARLVQLSKLNTRPATARCSHLYLDLDNSFKGNGDNDEEIERLSRQVEAVAQELGADSVTMNPLYSMESPVKISQPKTPNPPAVKMGRKNYVYPGGADASLLSTSISDMSQDDREGSLLSLEAHLAASEAAIRNNAYTPMAPPSPIVIHSGFSKPASGAGSLDRSGRGPVRKLREGEIRGGSERDSRRKPSAAAGGVHAGFHSGAQRAPTPPLHRCPSWESRIYQVTSSGLHQSCNSLASSATGQKSLDIPMYTAVHGRAAKVTSATAESSDESSDGEAVTPKATDHALGMGHTAAGYHRTSHNNAPGHFKRDGSLDSVLSEDYAIPPDALSPSVSMDSLEPGTRETGEGPSDLTGVVTPPAAPLGHPLASPLGAGPRNGVHHGHTTGTHHGGPSHAAHMFVEQIEALHAHSASPKRHDTTTTHQLTEKCGYLSKLGGPLKTWRKRWFVLREGRLHYYKSEGDVLRRKVKGEVVLDEAARVQRTNEGMPTFEVVTARRTFSLTADSMLLMEEWLRAIQNALCRNATVQLLNSQDGTVKPVIQGWCTKVKHGRCRNCWCVLFQRTLLYFRSPNDTTPLGQINMRDCRVDEVDHVSSDSSDEDEVEDASREEGGSSSGPRAGGSAGTSRSYKESRRFTIGIFPSGGASTSASPSYLLFHDKHDFDTWLYHLTLVSSSEHVNGTELEQVLAKLAEAQEMGGGGGDGAASQTLWRSSILLFSRESLSTPLTSLPSSELQAEALKMFKSIQLFMSVPLDTSGIDYHVALAQNALDLCLATLQLRNEFFCQIIKQTSRHTHKQGMQQFLLCATQSLFLCDSNERLMREDSKLSDSLPSPGDKACAPVAFASTESKLNPAPFVFIQGFQLLAIALSLFQPRSRVLWFLRQHLTRVGDANTEIGKWALFCERALQRALDRPERACRPSRMEVLSLLLKNPYHHSHPHSIPVHFLNGTYQVVGFDGSTTVDEFVTTLNEEVNIRPCAGFYLFSDDPMDPTAEICLQPEDRLCDAISQWEQALREKHLGKFEMNKVIKLTYRNRLFFRASQKGETDKERLLTVYFLNREIVQGRFPLTKQMAVEFSALMAQIEFGDRGQHVLDESHSKSSPKRQILDRLLAAQFARDPDCWPQLEAKWVALRGRSTSECVRIFLNCVRSWHLCGAQLFSARYKSREQVAVWLSVNEDGVFLLDVASMKVLAQYPYAGLSTFGGCRGDFMLVAAAAGSSGPQDKMMFHIHSKQKMLELTLLIADYMNNVLGRFGTSQPASQASTLTAARSGIATPSSPLIGGDRALRSAKNSPMHTLKTSHHSSGLGAGEL